MNKEGTLHPERKALLQKIGFHFRDGEDDNDNDNEGSGDNNSNASSRSTTSSRTSNSQDDAIQEAHYEADNRKRSPTVNQKWYEGYLKLKEIYKRNGGPAEITFKQQGNRYMVSGGQGLDHVLVMISFNESIHLSFLLPHTSHTFVHLRNIFLVFCSSTTGSGGNAK